MYTNNDIIKFNIIDCVNSLNQAVQTAGGAVSDEILNMSVREFIAKVAGQNHIRFVYMKPEHEENAKCIKEY